MNNRLCDGDMWDLHLYLFILVIYLFVLILIPREVLMYSRILNVKLIKSENFIFLTLLLKKNTHTHFYEYSVFGHKYNRGIVLLIAVEIQIKNRF